MDLANTLKTQLTPVLKREGVKFIAQSQGELEGVTVNKIGAIWRSAVHESLILPRLPDDPTPEELALVEELIAINDRDLEIISELEKEDAEKVKIWKARALKITQSIGVSAAAGVMLAAKNALSVTP